MRLQGLGGGNTLNLALSGQWTRDNLDSVEKLVVGGPYGLRGYDMGVLSADTAYLAGPVGTVPASLSNRTTTRGWVQLGRAF